MSFVNTGTQELETQVICIILFEKHSCNKCEEMLRCANLTDYNC